MAGKSAAGRNALWNRMATLGLPSGYGLVALEIGPIITNNLLDEGRSFCAQKHNRSGARGYACCSGAVHSPCRRVCNGVHTDSESRTVGDVLHPARRATATRDPPV